MRKKAARAKSLRTDRNLIEAFARGDPVAVEAIVRHYYPSLLNFLVRVGCPWADAEDVAQQTFLKAARGLRARYQHRERFGSWLLRIAHNTLRDHTKKASYRRELLSDTEEPVFSQSDIADLDEELIRKDTARIVQQAVHSLPEPQRLCLILRFYHGLSINEIAEVAGCPPGTVKSRLHTAIQRIKAYLEEWNQIHQRGRMGCIRYQQA